MHRERRPLGAGWLAAGAFLAGGVCSGCLDTDASTDPLPDRDQIATLLADWQKFVEIGGSKRARDVFSDDFLDGGRGPAAVDAWIGRLIAVPNVRVTVTDRRLTVKGDAADMDYLLQVESCPPPPAGKKEPQCVAQWRCRPGQGGDCEWFAHWKRTAAGWRVIGDRAPVRLELAAVDDGQGPRLHVALHDPQTRVTGATVVPPQGSAALPLLALSSTEWGLPADATPPSLPLADSAYPLTVVCTAQTNAGPVTLQRSIKARAGQFRLVTSPGAKAALPLQFRWQTPDVADGATEVEVLAAGTPIWRSQPTLAAQLAYGGPPLVVGAVHGWRVSAVDVHGNRARASGQFLVVTPDQVPPVPTLVVPAVGKAKGGELIQVHGRDFQATTRVYVGAAKCGGVEFVSAELLRCVTPALAPGTYPVATVAESNVAGWLDSAYTVQ